MSESLEPNYEEIEKNFLEQEQLRQKKLEEEYKELQFAQKQNQQSQQTEQQDNKLFIPSCGGPLVCVDCAMRFSAAYFQGGKGVWSDYYYRHAIKLKNEAEIGRLQQENQQLILANAQLEKDMWKTHTGSNGVS